MKFTRTISYIQVNLRQLTLTHCSKDKNDLSCFVVKKTKNKIIPDKYKIYLSNVTAFQIKPKTFIAKFITKFVDL